jgi:hypothetical protein
VTSARLSIEPAYTIVGTYMLQIGIEGT